MNPKPNGISHFYQLDQSISILRVVVSGIFFFFQILIEQFACLFGLNLHLQPNIRESGRVT